MALRSAAAARRRWPAPSGSRWRPRSSASRKSRSGFIPGGGGTQRLPRLVGKGRALQLILSGEMISAQEAYRIGLVNEIVPAADLIARAEAILNKIAANAPDRRQVRARGGEQGAGDEPERRLAARSFLLRPLRRNRGQERGHGRLPRKARARSSTGGENSRSLATNSRRDPMASDNIFSGLKVVDLASFIAGPSAAVILSDFGADVIKVEPPTGDLWRHGHKIPPQPQAKDAYPWHLANRNKRGIDARSEIAERRSRFSSGWSNGPTCSSSTRRIPRASD